MQPSFFSTQWCGSRSGLPGQERFVWSSPAGALYTEGCHRVLMAPAYHGEQPNGKFQQEVRQAFQQAQQAGIPQPIMVGAIPFDTRQPAMLYIPCGYRRLSATAFQFAAARADLPAAPTVKRLHEYADFGGYQQAVNGALQRIVQERVDRLAVGRQLWLDITDPLPVGLTMARLMRHDPHAYHFSVPLSQGTLLGASPQLLIRQQATWRWTMPMADVGSDRKKGLRQPRSRCRYAHCSHHSATARLSLLRSQRRNASAETALSLACRFHALSVQRQLTRLEPVDRGPFGGFVGWCDAQGNGEWAVARGCGLLSHQRLKLYATASITADSLPAAKWCDTTYELGALLHGLGIDAPALQRSKMHEVTARTWHNYFMS